MTPEAALSRGGRTSIAGRIGRSFAAAVLLLALTSSLALPAASAAEPADAAQADAEEAERNAAEEAERKAEEEAERKAEEEAERKAEEEAERKAEEEAEAERKAEEEAEAERKAEEEAEAERKAAEEAERARKLEEVLDGQARFSAQLDSADGALTRSAWSLNGAIRDRIELEGVIAAAEAKTSSAREASDAAAESLTVADEGFAEQRAALATEAVAAYQHSDTQQARLMMIESLVRARTPADFVTGLTYLDSMLGDRAANLSSAELRLEEAREDLAEAQERVEVAEREHASAVERLPGLQEREAGQRHAFAAARARHSGEVVMAASFAARFAGEDDEIADAAGKITARAAQSRDLAAATVAGAGRSAEGADGPVPWEEASCPIDGPVHFTNDWGFPRSNGRSHEGTDVFAARGTPIVAMRDAVVKRVVRADVGLGGRSVTYVVDGFRIYNAHLDEVAPGLNPGDHVRQGQVLGTVGTSGNAKSTPPHDHVGLYRDRQALNPYPLLALACGAERGAPDTEVPRTSRLGERDASL